MLAGAAQRRCGHANGGAVRSRPRFIQSESRNYTVGIPKGHDRLLSGEAAAAGRAEGDAAPAEEGGAPMYASLL